MKSRRPTSHSQGGGRRRAREFALQGLYQWLLARTPPPAIRAHLAESSGFDRCDTAFFDGLWQGVTGEFDTLIAALAPYLDRAPEQLSPVEKSVLAIGAWTVTVSLAVWFLLKMTVGIRVSPDQERDGLDGSEHGIEAYAGFVLVRHDMGRDGF